MNRVFYIGSSRAALMRVLSMLGGLLVKPTDDLELELRPRRKEKSHQQRKYLHKICTDIGKQLGYTMGQVKAMVKEEHFGADTIQTPSGRVYHVIQSSEDEDRGGYSALIETALRWGAENGAPVDDPRPVDMRRAA